MEKDIVTYKKTVDSLHRQQVKHMQKPCFVTSSAIARSCVNKATTRTLGKDTLTARDALIRTLSGIPNFSAEDVTVDCDEVGKGQFGTVKTALLHKLEMTVVAKVFNEKCHKKAILAKALVGLTLGGHINFPFCFGMLGDSIILMEYLHCSVGNTSRSCSTFAEALREGIQGNKFMYICSGILSGVIYMHSRQILHNDIKADNVVVANTAKIIDFGKATLISKPVVYNIVPGSSENTRYNSVHRHLANKHRYVPGSSQTIATDTYSVGHLFKHAGAEANCEYIIKLGREMKCISPDSRLSLKKALENVNTVSVATDETV